MKVKNVDKRKYEKEFRDRKCYSYLYRLLKAEEDNIKNSQFSDESKAAMLEENNEVLRVLVNLHYCICDELLDV